MHVHIIWAEHVFLSVENFAEMTDTIAEICEVLVHLNENVLETVEVCFCGVETWHVREHDTCGHANKRIRQTVR